MRVDLERLRLAVYGSLARTGTVPALPDLAATLGTDVASVADGLGELAELRHVVLGPGGEVLLAHPFAAVSFGFSVMGRDTLWWGGCAWDSFAIPHLLPAEGTVLVATRCPACGTPHAWDVGHEHPPAGAQVAHFLVPAAHIWDDVVHSCSNQRIFCSEECVDDWLVSTGQPKGYVLDLTTLWNLAAHWYDGRLSYGYERREPALAADYLRSVGLTGPFWGG